VAKRDDETKSTYTLVLASATKRQLEGALRHARRQFLSPDDDAAIVKIVELFHAQAAWLSRSDLKR
jgi:hypothetical protein